jgi:hypothetical protein
VENHINYLALQYLQSNNCYQKYGFQVTNEYVWSWDGLSFVKFNDSIDFNTVCVSINDYIYEQCGEHFQVLKYVVKSYDEYVMAVATNSNNQLSNVLRDNFLHHQMLESRELQYDDWKEWFEKEYTVFRIFKKFLIMVCAICQVLSYVLLSRTTLASMFCDFQYTVLTRKKENEDKKIQLNQSMSRQLQNG